MVRMRRANATPESPYRDKPSIQTAMARLRREAMEKYGWSWKQFSRAVAVATVVAIMTGSIERIRERSGRKLETLRVDFYSDVERAKMMTRIELFTKILDEVGLEYNTLGVYDTRKGLKGCGTVRFVKRNIVTGEELSEHVYRVCLGNKGIYKRVVVKIRNWHVVQYIRIAPLEHLKRLVTRYRWITLPAALALRRWSFRSATLYLGFDGLSLLLGFRTRPSLWTRFWGLYKPRRRGEEAWNSRNPHIRGEWFRLWRMVANRSVVKYLHGLKPNWRLRNLGRAARGDRRRVWEVIVNHTITKGIRNTRYLSDVARKSKTSDLFNDVAFMTSIVYYAERTGEELARRNPAFHARYARGEYYYVRGRGFVEKKSTYGWRAWRRRLRGY